MHNILLVEDNRMNQLLTVRILESQGHNIAIANNGAEALALTSVDHFDAILMDCEMPVMDGFQVTAAIREREALGIATYTPIIGLSGRSMHSDRANAIAAGMDDYPTKGLRADELRSTVQRWIDGEQPATAG